MVNFRGRILQFGPRNFTESSPYALFAMSREEDTENFLQRLQSEEKRRETKAKRRVCRTLNSIFVIHWKEKISLICAGIEQPEQDSSQERESFISAKKSENKVMKTKSE